MNPYTALGIDEDADDETIKKAYRRLAMEHHPDRGGDDAVFKHVKEAYELLSDPERRAHYDETGSSDMQDERGQARALVTGLLNALLDDAWDKDIVAAANEHLDVELRKAKDHIASAKAKVSRLERRMKKAKFRGEGVNLIEVLGQQQIRTHDESIVKAEKAIRIFNHGKAMLKDYEFGVEAQPTMSEMLEWATITTSSRSL